VIATRLFSNFHCAAYSVILHRVQSLQVRKLILDRLSSKSEHEGTTPELRSTAAALRKYEDSRTNVLDTSNRMDFVVRCQCYVVSSQESWQLCFQYLALTTSDFSCFQILLISVRLTTGHISPPPEFFDFCHVILRLEQVEQFPEVEMQNHIRGGSEDV
jgi:hypothetical protein